MLTFMLDITVKKGFAAEAIETLFAIEKAAHDDKGCINFIWLQNENETQKFTLFEQWESQEYLDTHLKRNPAAWEHFTARLETEPYSESFRLVSTLAEQPDEQQIQHFIETWFDKLSRHVAVEELLPMLADDDLQMIFPGAMLKDKIEFAQWYGDVGRLYDNQVHILEKLEVHRTPNVVNINLTVIWKARLKSDNSRQTSRAQQVWSIRRSLTSGQAVIVKYQVLSLQEIS